MTGSSLISHSIDDPNISHDDPPRPVSALPSRQPSFAENLDQLALISIASAHRFPASDPQEEQIGRSTSSASSKRSTRSTPSSPRLAQLSLLSPDRRAISRPTSPSFSSRRISGQDHSHTSEDASSIRRRRTRSWVHIPGAAFTPATRGAAAQSSSSSSSSSSTTRITPQRQVSSPGINVNAISADVSRPGRMRSTSASSVSPPQSAGGTFRRLPHQARRRPSSSARTSPTASPLHPLTPVEQPRPQRTHSVPQLASISPIMFGFGYHYASRDSLQTNQLGLPEGYFALPPSHISTPPSGSPLHTSDDVPPPYTASQVDLHALSISSALDRPVEPAPDRPVEPAPDREEDDEEEEGIVSFSTQSRCSRDLSTSREEGGLRRRREMDEPIERNEETTAPPKQSIANSQFQIIVLRYILQPLRLLAAVPGCIGTFWLLRNSIFLIWSQGSIWRHQGNNTLPSAIEFGMASLWSLATAYHALSFTTLLLRRWVYYYSILSSFIRLIALQAICWPLVRLTLFILGTKNPLAGWVIISTTTAFSDTVARWLVSNITTDDPSTMDRDSTSTRMTTNRKRRKRKSGATAFWRAIMGGPSDSSNRSGTSNGLNSIHTNEPGHYFTESEADSDADIYRYRLNQRRLETYASNGSTRLMNESTRVARIFHWDVALRRNVLPLASLSFLSLLTLLLEQVHQRA